MRESVDARRPYSNSINRGRQTETEIRRERDTERYGEQLVQCTNYDGIIIFVRWPGYWLAPLGLAADLPNIHRANELHIPRAMMYQLGGGRRGGGEGRTPHGHTG